MTKCTVYARVKDEAKGFNETNDCAVKAVAAACEVPYGDAWAELDRLGRKPRKGTKNTLTKKAIENLGFTPVLMSYDEIDRKGRTVKSFVAGANSQEVYVVWNRRHILTIREGYAQDWTEGKAMRIQGAWRIEK